MKNQTFSAWKIGRRLALGAVTLVLVMSAADRGRASAGNPGNPGPPSNDGFQRNQSTVQRGQATPAPQSQHGPPQRLPWWKDPAVIKEIGLTQDQASKIDALWRKRETEMQWVAKEFERQLAELRRLTDERKVGVDVIGIQHDRVEAQRTTLSKSRAIALYQSSLVLSAEQNKMLRAIGERNRRDRR